MVDRVKEAQIAMHDLYCDAADLVLQQDELGTAIQDLSEQIQAARKELHEAIDEADMENM